MSEKKNEFLDPPHNSWSTIFYAIGGLSLISPFVFFLIFEDPPPMLWTMAIVIVALQFFFIGHLVQLVTDMRHYLRDLAKNIH